MRYFLVSTLGDIHSHDEWVFVGNQEKAPSWASTLFEGCPIPSNGVETLRVGPFSGTRLGSLVGNHLDYLIIDPKMQKALEDAKDEHLQFLPVRLLAGTGEVAADNHCVVNTTCFHDVLDEAQSIRGGSHHFVFRQTALADAPNLIRIPQRPRFYFVSERVASWWKEDGCSNVFLTEVEVA